MAEKSIPRSGPRKRKKSLSGQSHFSKKRPPLPRHEPLVLAGSSTTLKNIKRTRGLIKNLAKHHHALDSKVVHSSSSVLAINLLGTYYRSSLINALGDDSMGAPIYGLRHVF